MKKDIQKVREYYDQKAKDYKAMWYDHTKADMYPADVIRVQIVINRLKETGAKTVLDAGCGGCVPMVMLLNAGFNVQGCDLSPEMIKEGKKELEKAGYSPDLITEANLEDGSNMPSDKFDAVMSLGAFPHIPDQSQALKNIHKRLNDNGRVYIEFRNELFAAFTFNRYSTAFFLNKVIDLTSLPERLRKEATDFCFERCNTPPSRGHDEGIDYEEILSQFRNPLAPDNLFCSNGFEIINHHFYHYHALPPIFEKKYPKLFKELSLKLEKPLDWKGHLMASAYVLEAKNI